MNMDDLDMLLVNDDELDMKYTNSFFDANMDIPVLDDILLESAFPDNTDLFYEKDDETTCEFESETSTSPFSSPCSESEDSSSVSGSPLNSKYIPVSCPTWKPMIPAIVPQLKVIPEVVTMKEIPYAMPIGNYNAFNMNVTPQINNIEHLAKRRLPEVLDNSGTKRSKHEIRLMKNRESANKSRLRRKSQINDLTNEVAELTKDRNALATEVAALRAENKSLQDQNSFLRGLVSGSKQIRNDDVDLESPEVKTTVESKATPKKVHVGGRKKISGPMASFLLCACICGVTMMSDPYTDVSGVNGASRKSMRTLHSTPNSFSGQGVSSISSQPFTFSCVLPLMSSYIYDGIGFGPSSKLVEGILINVFSVGILIVMYYLYRSYNNKPLTDHIPRKSRSGSTSSDTSSFKTKYTKSRGPARLVLRGISKCMNLKAT